MLDKSLLDFDGWVGAARHSDLAPLNQIPFMPIYRDGETIFPESPEEMAGYVKKIIEAGANIIGGCCGTTPDHIRKIAEIVRN